ncbi:MAG: FKBP-type peptidyl-prolyl cis-trans isomerase [Candidatus Thermoplasmatota archaeon]|nr:FKBP-type peptidyl-prolyl cis-trans isomerase [Candidatus Thermoplasmatota archaeon]
MQKGDIIKVDYELKIKETGKVIDTTKAEAAKAAGIFQEGAQYTPMPMIVGAGRTIKGFEDVIAKTELGKEIEAEIPAKEAYGERDASKVETIALREFMNQENPIYPGATVQVKGKSGTIQTITPGRVRVDFNHPLAGKTLQYKLKIVSKAATADEKVKDIIGMHYMKPEEFKVAIEADVATITLAEICKYDPNWPMAKYKIVGDMREYGGVANVKLVEEYAKKAEPAKK